MTLRATLSGVGTALRLPWLMRSEPLRGLMQPVSTAGVAAPEPTEAMEAALGTLRVLAHLRTPLWRNTCLYRSVLRCELLRGANRPAVVRIGAARGPGRSTPVVAHAWVEIDGEPLPDEALPFTPLHSVRRAG